VVGDRTFGADDLAAVVAVSLEAVLADQRAYPRRLQLDRIERVEARQLDVEFGYGVLVEQRQRALRRHVPFAIGGAGEAADAAQLDLHRFDQIGLRRPRTEGGKVRPTRGRGGSLVVGSVVVGSIADRGAG